MTIQSRDLLTPIIWGWGWGGTACSLSAEPFQKAPEISPIKVWQDCSLREPAIFHMRVSFFTHSPYICSVP